MRREIIIEDFEKEPERIMRASKVAKEIAIIKLLNKKNQN
jgi:hypothetical protein